MANYTKAEEQEESCVFLTDISNIRKNISSGEDTLSSEEAWALHEYEALVLRESQCL